MKDLDQEPLGVLAIGLLGRRGIVNHTVSRRFCCLYSVSFSSIFRSINRETTLDVYGTFPANLCEVFCWDSGNFGNTTTTYFESQRACLLRQRTSSSCASKLPLVVSFRALRRVLLLLLLAGLRFSPGTKQEPRSERAGKFATRFPGHRCLADIAVGAQDLISSSVSG